MARPRSEDRRQAILSATTRLIAVEGLAASTANIAKAAAIPNGAVFTYFDSKQHLLNELYTELKLELVNEVLADLPTDSARNQLRHMWTQWTNWGAKFPHKRRALAQLSVSDQITGDTREAALTAAGPSLDVIDQARRKGSLKNVRHAFVGAIVEALASTTIDFMILEPARAAEYREAGFESVWKAIT